MNDLASYHETDYAAPQHEKGWSSDDAIKRDGLPTRRNMTGRIDTVFDVLHTVIDTGRLASDAGTVVTLRLMGLAGAWTLPRDEASIMVQEKPAAFTDAFLASSRAAWAGNSPSKIVRAGLEPLSDRARSNRKRLSEGKPRMFGLPGPQ